MCINCEETRKQPLIQQELDYFLKNLQFHEAEGSISTAPMSHIQICDVLPMNLTSFYSNESFRVAFLLHS